MRYLINRKTKEHKLLHRHTEYATCDWHVVQADYDGWIKHEGNECPLPEDVRCAVKCADGSTSNYSHKARQWGWETSGEMSDITHYKPILDPEKVQEPVTDAARKGRAAELSQIELAGKRMMLLDRLKAAHEHAQQIPDLETELREVLGSMGYDLLVRSPFVEPEPAVETPQDKVIAGALFDFLGFLTTRDKPTSFGSTRNASPAVELLQEWADKRGLDLKDAAVESWRYFTSPCDPEPDMTDWRNWREGDLVECVNGSGWSDFTKGGIYAVSASRKNMIEIAGNYIWGHFINDFRFHSRPAKGEK